MSGEKADKFFSMEDLNADYGRKYRRTKLLNCNKENVVVDFAVADRCALSSSTGMLTESTPNIVRLVGKRRKFESNSLIVTPRSNSRRKYMNPPEGSQDRTPLSDVTNLGSASFPRNMVTEETRSNINDFSLNGREPLNQKGKENYLGFGRELFADEFVTDYEEESPNVVAPSLWSDDSEGSDYEASGCESSDDADCLSWSHDGDDEDIVDEINSDCNLMQSRHASRRVISEEYASLGGPTAICAVRLPQIPPTPQYLLDLYHDKKRGPSFHRLIQLYNAMFAFTSTGGNIDHSINSGRAPYVYRLNGQNHHVFGSLIPNDNETPKFCQLYIYDTINEVDNRLWWVSVQDRESVDKEVVRGLITMLDETNQLVGEFRQQRDLHESDEIVELQITLKVIKSESGRECYISSTDEVAGIMVGNTEETCGDRDIVVNEKGKGSVRVSNVHPKLMALQYPLLFPRGEDGFHPKIKFQRTVDSLTPRLGGRLFQQYMVDAFSTIEQTRLWWFRTHQTTLQNELYNNICKSVSRGDVDSSNIGKGIVLPAGYVGSKRYMQQNFQDALAVCRYIGHPDIFLTMTCNSLWDETKKMMEYVPGCIAPNCPDIISRVFRLKLDHLMVDVKDKKHFGVCIGVMYVVEFQKKGLPHVHMLIWLDADSKNNLKQNVDKFVSAEIPDPYCARSTFDDGGFPIYMRRRTNITVEIRKTEMENQWVVPYNQDLLVKYQCHMNVEIYCHARSLKYLFKYYLKGHNRATVQVQRKRKRQLNDNDEGGIDEINAYFDGKYLCGAESAYRIFGFPIHHRIISVERLPFHLPGDKNCTFRANEVLGKVASREKNKFSKLEVFFLNFVDVNAWKYTYDDIPRFNMWNDGERRWSMRKRGFQIGRLCYAHHSTEEPWFLHLLLTKVRGATSFESFRTVNRVCYSIFRDACKEYGLLDDDKEWHEMLTQASAGGLPPQIRQLFVHIIVNCIVTDLKTLWKIDELLRLVGKSLKKFDQLPQPPCSYLNNGTHNLIIEKTSYDTRKMDNIGGIFFVYGSGGCGKTFLWRTLIYKLRSESKIVLPVASSGIAATLMPGGRTAQSRFKIPIVLDECSTCNIAHDSDIAQLIKHT
ncbi:uncharacterized protein LOC141700196 [Apium graveolens]|uniref:uncharacterized protein LOC141700196 n=1 Tax=Apium graveolens TaxID=4045 RepID=UPI003D7AE326